MAVDFGKFKNMVDQNDLKAMEDRFASNGGNFTEIPSGVYPVELDRMEIGKSSWGADQVNITFKITDGSHKGQLIFYNGTLDDHFAHGNPQTARLISEMTDGEVDKFSILKQLDGGTAAASFLTELFQAIADQLCFDLDYQVKESTKLNPNTNKPYINKFYSIKEVFEK